MCGVVGFLRFSSNNQIVAPEAILDGMARRIRSRGPDDMGVWFQGSSGVGLGHRRLSILDVSAAGHQPMKSNSGRYVLVFNGEIYNHLDLREELSSIGGMPAWRGHSDTETLLACFDVWGVQDTIKRSIGMFAMAVWDSCNETMLLIRDRFGEKPMYYGWQSINGDQIFLFASELKALKAYPGFIGEINRHSLSLMMRYSYIPAPLSIYQNIFKLPPGKILTVSLKQQTPKISTYWDASEIALNEERFSSIKTEEEVIGELDLLLKDSVRQQMIADVPLGAFLSGGVDSSTIVALMQAQSPIPVKTFSIGFNEDGYDEAGYAKKIANYLGTDHTELYVTSNEAMNVIPKLSTLYDEPFADSSQIPTYLVSKLARQHVAVSLSGDAGDEIFCGYNRYLITSNLWKKLNLLPPSLRRVISKSVTEISPGAWDKFAQFSGASRMLKNAGDKLHKGAEALIKESDLELYQTLISRWDDPGSIVISGGEISGGEMDSPIKKIYSRLLGLSLVDRMMVLDTLTYLPDDILVKVDRAAMGVSLETRVPFLDHRIYEFAWKLPLNYKLRNGTTKWVLRQVLYKHIPKELMERPKMGFAVPIGEWLRGPLRDWAENLLDENRLRREGYFYPTPIRQKWAEHLSGSRNWQHHLWNVLMFQAWLENEPSQ